MLAGLTGRDLVAALPALVAALGDEDERVAVLAAGSLGKVLRAASIGGDRAAVRAAVTAPVAAGRAKGSDATGPGRSPDAGRHGAGHPGRMPVGRHGGRLTGCLPRGAPYLFSSASAMLRFRLV